MTWNGLSGYILKLNSAFAMGHEPGPCFFFGLTNQSDVWSERLRLGGGIILNEFYDPNTFVPQFPYLEKLGLGSIFKNSLKFWNCLALLLKTVKMEETQPWEKLKQGCGRGDSFFKGSRTWQTLWRYWCLVKALCNIARASPCWMLGIRDAGSRLWAGQLTLLEMVMEDLSFVWVSFIHSMLIDFFHTEQRCWGK